MTPEEARRIMRIVWGRRHIHPRPVPPSVPEAAQRLLDAQRAAAARQPVPKAWRAANKRREQSRTACRGIRTRDLLD